jgi:DNA-binding response OmpR family regulator
MVMDAGSGAAATPARENGSGHRKRDARSGKRQQPAMYRRPHHVLVVDDDPAAQHQTMALLQQRDYVLATAWTLEEAYARVAEQAMDLVIAGTRIGSLSGLQFIVSCRARRPELTGILLAAQREHVPEMEAWRHGITPIVVPLDADHFLMTVAEKLAAIRRRQRWPRKRVQADVPVEVSGTPGRLLDVSYGGLRVEMAGESYDLRTRVQVDIPLASLRVNGELVWSARARDGATCLCGVSIIGDRHPVPMWRDFVDNLD